MDAIKRHSWLSSGVSQMALNLFQAAQQWSTRPADERFWGISDARKAAEEYKGTAVEFERPWGDLRVEAVDGDVKLMGKAGVPATLTHYAFGQLAVKAGAPSEYLRRLPATLAAQNVNHGLKANVAPDSIAALMAHKNGDFVLRAALSQRYERVWNADILRIMEERLTPNGWRTPPARPALMDDARARPATAADVIDWGGATGGGAAIQVGDMIAPAGVYVSDHDMFALLVLPGVVAEVPGSTLTKFVMLSNSEVGDASLSATMGYLDMVCGNHILWGCRDVREMRIRHVGEVDRKFRGVQYELARYAEDGVSQDAARIVEAQGKLLGTTKDEVLETLLGLNARKKLGLTQGLMMDAYEVAERTPRYGDPKSVWAIANGLTEVSQRTTYAEDRAKVDRAAGKLLDVVF